MASFFILALAAVLIWLFAESKTSRIVGFSIVGVIAVALGLYIIWRETQSSSQDHLPQTTTAQPQSAPEPAPIERSLTALKPSDVRLQKLALESQVETYFGIDGKQYERPDLKSWTLKGEAVNLSAEYTVKDVTLNVRLYSCPNYYTTPFEEVKAEELSLICSKIGERSLGLYDLNISPEGTKPFAQPFTFANQGEAINWRFWVEVTRLVAQAD
jgi:hypothetical protein